MNYRSHLKIRSRNLHIVLMIIYFSMKKTVLQPAFHYYKKLCIDGDGDCCHISKMAEACDIFNSMLLKDISETEIVTKLHYMVDKLIHFKYTNIFTEDFMRRLKKEMSSVVEAAKNHNLDNIKGGK